MKRELLKHAGVAAVDRRLQTPLYMQLARQLQEGVLSGRWSAPHALPSERMLSDALSVSRGTARKALELLRERGVLLRRQGSGSYAALPALDAEAAPAAPALDVEAAPAAPALDVEAAPAAPAPRVRWLERERRRATPEEMLALALSPGAEVLRLTRLGRTGTPGLACLCISSVPVQWLATSLPGLPPDGALDPWFDEFGPTRLLQRVGARAASAETARLLGVAQGTALLHVMQVRYGAQGQALELCHSYSCGSDAVFVTELQRSLT